MFSALGCHTLGGLRPGDGAYTVVGASHLQCRTASQHCFLFPLFCLSEASKLRRAFPPFLAPTCVRFCWIKGLTDRRMMALWWLPGPNASQGWKQSYLCELMVVVITIVVADAGPLPQRKTLKKKTKSQPLCIGSWVAAWPRRGCAPFLNKISVFMIPPRSIRLWTSIHPAFNCTHPDLGNQMLTGGSEGPRGVSITGHEYQILISTSRLIRKSNDK